MLFTYFVVTILIGLGFAGTLFELIKIIRWKRAIKIDAQIIEVSDETWNDGRIRFRYKFQFEGQSHVIWGPWYETFNPLLCLFPKSRIGKIVSIRFNKRKMKIEQVPLVSVLFGVFGIVISLCGFIIFACL